MKDQFGYVRNHKTGIFEATKKEELLHNVLAELSGYLNEFYDDYGEDLNAIQKVRIEKEMDKYDERIKDKIRLCRK